MKKFILLAVTFTAMFVIFQSCKKEVQRNSESVHNGDLPARFDHCGLSAINELSYMSLGVKLCGAADGIGTLGALDKNLNCFRIPGATCSPIVSGNAVYVTTLSATTGWNVLSDGVMSVTEQQTLVNNIKSACNAHVLSTFGTGYEVYDYDVWFGFPLCGGCSQEIYIFVDYKGLKPCPFTIEPL